MSGTGFLKEKPHGPTGVASAGQEKEEENLEIAREEAEKNGDDFTQ